MPRPLSKLAPDWWDYTTLDPEILADAARLTPRDLLQLSRPGFTSGSTIPSKSFTAPKLWNTSKPGNKRRRTIPSVSAVPSAPPSNSRS